MMIRCFSCLLLIGTASAAYPNHGREEGEVIQIEKLYEKAPNPYWLDANKSSGAWCIFFLARYYGLSLSYRDVITSCPPSKDGIALGELVRGSKQHGLNAIGFGGRSALGLKRLSGPAIVWLQPDPMAPRQVDTGAQYAVMLRWDPSKGFLAFLPPGELKYLSYGEVARRFHGSGVVVRPESSGHLEEPFLP